MGLRVKKKTVSFFLFGFVTVVFAAVSIALYVIDWNKYRDTLAELASERLGVRVELAGDLSLGFLPRPTISARLVRLTPGQPGFNDAIATADRVDMHLGLAAFFGGSLELQSLAFDGLTAKLLETPEGWIIEGWPQAVSSPEQGSAPTLLSLDRFRIKSGSIVAQRLSGQETTFEGLDLTLAGRLPTGPLDWDGSAVIAGRNVSVTGRVMPTRTEGSTSVKATISVEESMMEFSGRISRSGATQGRFRADGEDLNGLMAFLNAALGEMGSTTLPAIPFGLDVQIDRDGRGISRLISRQATLGETRAAVDLTVAEREDGAHVTGTVSLDVLSLDGWLAAQHSAAGAVVEPTDEAVNGVLAGSIDLSIESLEFLGGHIQQVASSIAISSGSAHVEQLSALLPGASRISYVADDRLNGTVQFQSGGLQSLMTWGGVPVSDAVPAGRLTTANLRGRLSVSGDAWLLTDVTGAVDTSAIAAEVSGIRTPFALTAIRAQADSLNLDAYWPASNFEKIGVDESSGNLQPLSFELSVGSLHWLDQNFTDVALTGALSAQELALNNISAGHMDGTTSGSSTVGFAAGAIDDAAVTLRFENWRFPILARMAPKAENMLGLFTDNEPTTGRIEANGPVDALQVRGDIATGRRSIDLAGQLSTAGDWQARLQGSIAHDNIGQLLHRARLWSGGADTTVALTANITMEGGAAAHTLTATGDLGGAQFSLSTERTAGGLSGTTSLSAGPGETTALDALAENSGYRLDTAAPRRARLSFVSGEHSWTISDLEIRNADAVVSGTLARRSGGIAGQLSARSIGFARVGLQNSSSGTLGALPASEIALDLQDIDWMGQRWSAPNAQLTTDDGGLRFTFGDGATLNESTLVADITSNETGDQLAVNGAFSSFDVGGFSQAIGADGGFSGTVAAEFDLSFASDVGQPVINTLSGQGKFEGGAGSLYFMAVPELINAIETGDSATAFLQSIGGLLRTGTTDFATIRGSFQMDNGVALVDELRADGDWGALELDGQLNIPGDYINMSGELALSRPIDAPIIPVTYEGPLSTPNVRWASRGIEQFAIAGIERRLRTRLFGELEAAQSGEVAAPNPGAIVSQMAIGLLGRLKIRQEQRRREAEAARRASETSSRETEGQTP